MVFLQQVFRGAQEVILNVRTAVCYCFISFTNLLSH